MARRAGGGPTVLCLGAKSVLAWQIFVVTSAVAVASSLVVATRRTVRRRTAVTVAGAVIALGAAVLTMATRSAVQVEQLAITRVAVASELSGYWYAAFDGGVLFLVIDGVEVSQRTYATSVVAHLAAPVVGFLVLIPAALMARRPADQAPETTIV